MSDDVRILKLFVLAEDQRALRRSYKEIARYDGFTLIEASEADKAELQSRYPLEDITDQYWIQLGERLIDTRRPRIDESGQEAPHQAYRGVKAVDGRQHHYLVQFIGPVKPAWVRSLTKLGAEPRRPIGSFTYIVRCKRALLKKIIALAHVRWVGHLSHRDRLYVNGQTASSQGEREVKGVFVVDFFDHKDRDKAKAAVRRAGARVLKTEPKSSIMVVRIDGGTQATLKALAAVHGVQAIRRQVIKNKANDVAAGLMGAKNGWNAPLGLTGRGEVIAICDTGLDTGHAENIHPDFRGRIVDILSYPINRAYADETLIFNPHGDDGGADLSDGHGTHVAGSALGSGAASEAWAEGDKPVRGLAPSAKVLFQAVEQFCDWRKPDDRDLYGNYCMAGFPDELKSLFSDAKRNGAWIHSNSWGGSNLGEYDRDSRSLDSFVWENDQFCILMAAGNEGEDRGGSGTISRNTISPPGTAKNCITVGASESVREGFKARTYGARYGDRFANPKDARHCMAGGPERVACFSSRGPAGGRIKPDIVAPGTFILSARSRVMHRSDEGWARLQGSDDYYYLGGTSMATPLVAGAVALLREFFRKHVGLAEPSAALVKASLIASARKIGRYSAATEICDVDQGYGLINLDAIVSDKGVYFIDEKDGLATGQLHAWQLTVRSDERPLRIALAYSDFPAETLVNNLNLILIDPDGRFHVGNGAGKAGLEFDCQNNTEVVQVSRPKKGRWTLRIVASNVAKGPQRYALCLRGGIAEPDHVG
ncbi:MAG: S8 family serine peptidase [Kiloniellales bacterium]|nr:S8 family serine peptidase [Kiloniellales bacterium]